MMGANLGRRVAMVVVVCSAVLVTGCGSQIPQAPPLPTLESGTWTSLDGQYSITLEENPNSMHFVLPMERFAGKGPECSRTGDYLPPVTVDGTWSVWEGTETLNLEYENVLSGFGQARAGDWAVIEHFPCGPDFSPLYLVRDSD